MRTLIIGGAVFLVWMLFARWHYVCKIQGLCGETTTEVETPILPEEVQEGKIELDENEKFVYTEKEVLPELNTENKNRIASIASQMKADQDMNLVIQGAFTPAEKDVKPGFFENLGIARADAVRKMLTDDGVEEDRISLDFVEDEGALENPIRFELTKKEIEAAQYTFTNMSFSDITFDSESAVFRRPTRQFQLYADSLRTFLQLNPDRTLIVTGHTDDQGTEDLNYKLGIRRGNSVRYYLQTTSKIKTPIEVRSKGETAPIADNSTAEGRRKNRRVQITIQ